MDRQQVETAGWRCAWTLRTPIKYSTGYGHLANFRREISSSYLCPVCRLCLGVPARPGVRQLVLQLAAGSAADRPPRARANVQARSAAKRLRIQLHRFT